MGFDEEVDAARARLAAAMQEAEVKAPVAAQARLSALLAGMRARIQSRRLAFALIDDAQDEGPFIEIVHPIAEEPLGHVFVEDGELVFESAHDDYFDDFVDEDEDSFLLRLYEMLRAELPKYEVETEID